MRKRVTEKVLQSWDEVNEALKNIGRADNAIAAIEARMNEQIAQVKAEAKAQAKEYEETKKLQEMMIQQYVSVNKSELKGKSHKLAFGVVGFRFSTKLVLPKEVKPVIEALRSNGMLDCLNQAVTINKEVLKTYAEEQILKVGGSLQKADTFWYEVDKESIQDK